MSMLQIRFGMKHTLQNVPSMYMQEAILALRQILITEQTQEQLVSQLTILQLRLAMVFGD